MLVKPEIVSSAPASLPKGISTPLHKITRAVSVQITMVSANTSKIPKYPCLTGFLVSAVAWAIEPVPKPASLEKIPLEIPFFMERIKLPTAPPVNALGEKAEAKIVVKTEGTLSK